MRLPKHKLPKNERTHGAHKVTRTSKHKAYKHLTAPVEEIEEGLMQIEQTTNSNTEERKQDDNDGESMELAETGSVTSQGRMKTKEEKKQIRELRKKVNAARNLYKKRNGNYSSKNGPRAINRGNNI